MKWIVLASVWGLIAAAVSWFAAMVKAKEPGDFVIWMAIGWVTAFFPIMCVVTGLVVSWRLNELLAYVG